MENQIIFELLIEYADTIAVPVIVSLIQAFKKFPIMDWGKLNLLHPLWLSVLWFVVRKLGLFMPVDLAWPACIIGIISTTILSIGVHSAGKNGLEWLNKWVKQK